jgi:hypothetical protein
LYFNVDHVRDCARRLIAAAGEHLRMVIWDLSSSPYVDIAGARMLGELQRKLDPSKTRVDRLDLERKIPCIRELPVPGRVRAVEPLGVNRERGRGLTTRPARVEGRARGRE